MATETLSYDVTVSAGQASKEIDKLEGAFKKAADSASKADRAVGSFEKTSAKAGGASSAASEKFADSAGKIDRAFGMLEKTMRGAGVASTETGKRMLEVVGSAGDIAQAFATGGPMLGALAAGTVVVGKLTQHWDDLIKKQDEAIRKQYEAFDKAAASRKSVEEKVAVERQKVALLKIKDPIERDLAELRLSMSDTLVEAANNLSSVDPLIAKQASATIRHANELLRLRAEGLELQKEEKEAPGNRKAAESAAAKAEKEHEESLDELIAYHEKWNEIEGKQIEKEEKDHEERMKRIRASLVAVAPGDGGPMGQAAGIGGKVSSEIDEANKQAALGRAMAEDFGIAWKMAMNDAGDAVGGWVGATSTGIGIMTSGLQQLTTDLVTGQEHVAERFGALVMQQAGQSLISSGTKLAGEAVVSAFTPGLQPLAAAQGAAAAGLIAGGIALGGAAAGLEHMAAGGELFKPLPDKDKNAKGDRGASPRSSRSGDSGGPLVINVSYGVAGPMPEDTAREIARALNTGGRRRGAA